MTEETNKISLQDPSIDSGQAQDTSAEQGPEPAPSEEAEPATQALPADGASKPVSSKEADKLETAEESPAPIEPKPAESPPQNTGAGQAPTKDSGAGQAPTVEQIPPALSQAEGFMTKFKNKLAEFRVLANRKRSQQMEKNLEKIMQYAREKQKVTNDEVERITGVRDAQAANYLNILVKQGKLIRFGKKKNIFYKPVKQ